MPDICRGDNINIDLNPDASIDIRHPGHERTPVVVMDDVAMDLHPLIQAGQQQHYSSPAQAAYPGVRAPLPKSYAKTLLEEIYALMSQVYGIPGHLRLYPQKLYYSLVSTPPEELARLQRVPHFDSQSPYYFAIMHYLSPGPHGGTGFFRHCPTGFENISAQRFPLFRQAAEAHMAAHGEPEARYQTDSDAHFERIDSIEYRQNRLIIYPGTLFHTGLINPKTDINPNPDSGRLTANLFIEFK